MLQQCQLFALVYITIDDVDLSAGMITIIHLELGLAKLQTVR
jgi:hypothetical protein